MSDFYTNTDRFGDCTLPSLPRGERVYTGEELKMFGNEGKLSIAELGHEFTRIVIIKNRIPPSCLAAFSIRGVDSYLEEFDRHLDKLSVSTDEAGDGIDVIRGERFLYPYCEQAASEPNQEALRNAMLEQTKFNSLSGDSISLPPEGYLVAMRVVNLGPHVNMDTTLETRQALERRLVPYDDWAAERGMRCPDIRAPWQYIDPADLEKPFGNPRNVKLPDTEPGLTTQPVLERFI